jgi:hypothetical protein
MKEGNGVCCRREKNQTVFRTDCERKQSVLRVGAGVCVRKIKEELVWGGGGEGGPN